MNGVYSYGIFAAFCMIVIGGFGYEESELEIILKEAEKDYNPIHEWIRTIAFYDFIIHGILWIASFFLPHPVE